MTSRKEYAMPSKSSGGYRGRSAITGHFISGPAVTDRLWALPDQLVVRPLGRRTVRAHRDPTVLHHAGTDRYSTTPGVTVVVDYTPGDGKAAMNALMSAVGEVRRQIEEER